jgi:hypothetical protein
VAEIAAADLGDALRHVFARLWALREGSASIG